MVTARQKGAGRWYVLGILAHYDAKMASHIPHTENTKAGEHNLFQEGGPH